MQSNAAGTSLEQLGAPYRADRRAAVPPSRRPRHGRRRRRVRQGRPRAHARRRAVRVPLLRAAGPRRASRCGEARSSGAGAGRVGAWPRLPCGGARRRAAGAHRGSRGRPRPTGPPNHGRRQRHAGQLLRRRRLPRPGERDRALRVAARRRRAHPDVGGESTRPGALPVAPEVELARVRPVLEALRAGGDAARRRAVHRHPPRGGHALRARQRRSTSQRRERADRRSRERGRRGGQPRPHRPHAHAGNAGDDERSCPDYEDVALDVYDYLEARVEACVAAGIDRSRLSSIRASASGSAAATTSSCSGSSRSSTASAVPILLGVSRKGLGGGLSSLPPASACRPRSPQRCTRSRSACSILRVHDVAATRQVVELWRRLSTD